MKDGFPCLICDVNDTPAPVVAAPPVSTPAALCGKLFSTSEHGTIVCCRPRNHAGDCSHMFDAPSGQRADAGADGREEFEKLAIEHGLMLEERKRNKDGTYFNYNAEFGWTWWNRGYAAGREAMRKESK